MPQTLLTQEEIEALLELVESERGTGVPEPAAGEKQQNAKRGAPSASQGTPATNFPDEEILKRDFSKPDRLPRDEFYWLQGEAAHAAARISESLTRWLRMDARVECISIETQQYQSFLASLASPCVVYHVHCGRESSQSAAISIDAALVLAIVDRVLGGKGKARFATRQLSNIELLMSSRLCDILLKSLSDGFADVLPIDLKPVGPAATHVRQARFMDNDTNIIIATYSISGDLAETEVRFLLPASACARREERIPAPAPSDAPPAIPKIQVDVAVRLAGTNITIQDLLDLDIGDVISLDHPAGASARIEVEGSETAFGKIGTRDNNLAVQIESVIPPAIARKPVPDAASQNS